MDRSRPCSAGEDQAALKLASSGPTPSSQPDSTFGLPPVYLEFEGPMGKNMFMSKATVQAAIEWIPVDQLHFDRSNPRLAGYGIRPNTGEDEIINTLWAEMAVDEVAMSVAASGFWAQEPLIVSSEKNKWVVIEGNRRLAAVKALVDSNIAKRVGTDLGKNLTKEVKATLETLPVIKTTREDSWRYLGFRHVNGPARWGSYAKAEYIRKVHDEYNVSLPDIAQQIGDRHKTVQRLYRALMVLDQAVREKVYSLDDREKKNLPFSHLYTGLDYDGFQKFLSLRSESDESDKPVPEKKLKELGQLMIWLFGSKKDNKPSIIRSQNPDLRNLDKVLRSEEARRALLRGSSLDDAVIMADPPKERLRSALLDSKNLLQTARGLVSEAYEGEEDILRTAGSVADLADKLYKDMSEYEPPKAKSAKIKSRLTDA